MKVLLEGWRQYLSEVYAVDIEKGSIVEVDEGGKCSAAALPSAWQYFHPINARRYRLTQRTRAHIHKRRRGALTDTL